jgi:hypothetical protein
MYNCLYDQQFLTKSIKLELSFMQSKGYTGSVQTKSKLASERLGQISNSAFHRSSLSTVSICVNPTCDFHALIGVDVLLILIYN